jgi:hypothetical protein
VRLRQAPNAAAAVVEQLSYDVVVPVKDDGFNPDLFLGADSPSGIGAWAHIVTASGKTGFVYGRYVASPIGTRFFFEQVNGAWKIVGIAAGD